MDNKPFFRPTDASFRKSVAVVSGSKTAGAKIQDLEDDDKILKEVQGYVERINMSQVQSNGWICRSDDGVKYNCSISSELYTVPEGTTKKGYLYPKKKMRVTISVNPVKRKYTITEITDGFSNIKNWVKEDTITLAHNNAAVQVSSDSTKIAYNDATNDKKENSVSVDANGVSVNGDVKVNGKKVEDILKATMQDYLQLEAGNSLYTQCGNKIMIEQSYNIANLTLRDFEIDIAKSGKRICHIYDEDMWPATSKSYLALSDSLQTSDILKVNTSGDIYLYTSGEEGHRVFNTSVTWVTNLSDRKNVIEFGGSASCTCNCHQAGEVVNTVALNYCPMCKTFGHLVQIENKIKCESCNSEFCGVCGRNLKKECDTDKKLKGDASTITAKGEATCKCCDGKKIVEKRYMNYCPKCKKWNTLSENKRDDDKTDIKCSGCSSTYCIYCGALNTNETTCKKQETRLIYIGRIE
jgi:hypothetical protein